MTGPIVNRREEETLYPDLSIVDPHHHLWGVPHAEYRVPDFARDLQASGHRVVGTVHVECQESYWKVGPEPLRAVGETAYVVAATPRPVRQALGLPGLCAGIVGYADFRLGAAVGEVLDAHLAAGDGRFRGIRHTAPADHNVEVGQILHLKPPGLLRDPLFRQGFAQLGLRELSFDAWVVHPQLDDVAALAHAFPETTIILNHAGGPVGVGSYVHERAHVFDVWTRGLRNVAREPNVYVKLGGLGMRLGGFGFDRQRQVVGSQTIAAAWQPYIETCIQLFGPERCMFESNFPVDGLTCSYATLWNVFKRLAAPYHSNERRELFAGTARRAYRLEEISFCRMP